MKKTLCFVLALMLMVSMFTVSTFAKEAEKVVWTQDFEKNKPEDSTAKWNNDTKTGTYADGLRFRHGSAAAAKATVVDGEYWMAATTSNPYGSRFKVYIDQSIFEDGKTYKMVADIKYVYNGTKEGCDNKTVKIGVYAKDDVSDLSASKLVGGKSTSCTIAAGQTITAETITFVFDADIYKGDKDTQINFVLSYNGVDDYNGQYNPTKDTVYVDNVRVVEVNYLDDVVADAGYYAATENGAATSGAISFTAKALYEKENVTEYGIYVYKNGDEFSEEFKGSSTEALDSDGFFNVIVNNIPSSEFDSKVVALPYVIINNVTYFGNIITYSVNDGGFWLGAE